MNYKHTLISLIGFSLASPFFATAIDTTTSGRILDNFKKEEQTLLFETMPFDGNVTNELLRHEYTINGLEGLKTRLIAMQQEYIEKKVDVSEKRLSLEQALESLDSAIADTMVEIKKTEQSILERDNKIEEYKEISIILKKKVSENRKIILSYLANVYSEGTLIYNQENNIDIFQSLLLSDSDIDGIATDILYKSLVSLLGQKFIQEYRTLLKDYTRISIRMNEEIKTLFLEKSVLVKQKMNLDMQRSQREKLLEITKGQEELFQKYIDAQQKAQETVEKGWQDANNAYTATLEKLLEKNDCIDEKRIAKNIDKCNSILAFYKNESALKKIDIGTGLINVLDWPIRPTRISTFFHDPEYYRLLKSQHEAVDLPIQQGTDIKAPLDGYIYYMLPPSEGGYSYLAIKHPDNYMTVYGHLSEILAKPYQFVKKGDIIARSGGLPGTAGAGPMTTGAHLHLEVFKNGKSIDPLRVLDLSALDYSSIPTRYQDKYISDIINKSGTGVNISKYERRFILKGNTEEEKQAYLLKTYAAPDFRSLNLWSDSSLQAKIDPSFLICVGLAETTLGNNLKTSFNVGNIGNTDDGSTYAFSSAKEGIQWMVATFNNKYLSQYDSVSKLSRWGNADGHIYASSNANWHNNVIRCLSSLKGRFVEDDYIFRVR